MGLVPDRNSTRWDWYIVGLVHSGTGAQWDWDTMELGHIGTASWTIVPRRLVVLVWSYKLKTAWCSSVNQSVYECLYTFLLLIVSPKSG